MTDSYYITDDQAKKYKDMERQAKIKIARKLNISETQVTQVLKGERKVTEAGLQILKLANEAL